MILIINLKRARARRQRITSRLTDLRLDYEILPAVDGDELSAKDWYDYDGESSRRHFGKDLTSYEYACCLSHLRAAEYVIKLGGQRVLVIEDDVTLADDLPSLLMALATAPMARFMVRLAGLRRRRTRFLAPLTGHYHLAQLLNTPSGAQAYLLDQQGAERLLAHGRPVFRVFDAFLDRYWERDWRPLAVQPYPIAHDHVLPSQIVRSDFQDRSSLSMMATWRIRAARMANSYAKVRYNFSSWSHDVFSRQS